MGNHFSVFYQDCVAVLEVNNISLAGRLEGRGIIENLIVFA
jgi:broad-specificity NMP kinase